MNKVSPTVGLWQLFQNKITNAWGEMGMLGID